MSEQVSSIEKFWIVIGISPTDLVPSSNDKKAVKGFIEVPSRKTIHSSLEVAKAAADFAAQKHSGSSFIILESMIESKTIAPPVAHSMME